MQVKSYNDFREKVSGKDNAFLLLYKSGSEQSECARDSLMAVKPADENVAVLMADVAEVRDIHGNYGITTVPTLLSFSKGELKNVYKGCQGEAFFKSVIDNEVYETVPASGEEKPQKRVVVYSTPTCPWCNRVKDYLRKNNIRFRDVDVSVDQAAAEAMVAKSGQRGVPQTEINGQIVVGFDQSKIDKLLGI